ncbi:MAG: GatB/YqeY domain-containing protein [Christensenellaceae bacterium]|nr:GatB/YqeY domain-containing protein [Christensenellaceae bacterium]
MSKTDEVRKAMMQAMKDGDKDRKNALSMLLAALKQKQIDKREDLTPEEEGQVVLKEIKQAQETIDTAPESRQDIIDEAKLKIEVMKEFAPKMMDESEIKDVIAGVLSSLGLDSPTAKDKGLIMKNLMPIVKGKADGGQVNRILGEILSKNA